MRERAADRDRRRWTGLLGLAAAFVLSLAALLPVAAETAAIETTAVEAALERAALIDLEQRKTRAELDAITGEIVLADETRAALGREIEALRNDRERIREAMIEAAEARAAAAADIRTTESEIEALGADEAAVRVSLGERRGTLAEVLGALERMAHRPPPALLVHPDDALGSVRSAILLGSVVPAIRRETDRLVADLQTLGELRTRIEERKLAFAEGLRRLNEEEERLALLFGEKERLEGDRREALDAMTRRTAELAGRAGSLEELIGALEGDLAAARIAEGEARRVAEERAEAERLAAAQALEEEAAASREREIAAAEALAEREAAEAAGPYDLASLRRDMARLEVSAAFSTLKSTLVPPVDGPSVLSFGDEDRLGRRADGATFVASAGDLVTAPADGHILYSGPFRTYGQLLIVNAGDGYHIVLAGMSEIDVAVGQFVLAGEPVAVMGARRLASAGSGDLPSTEPTLYVEFRKDGKPVDPTPWWTDGSRGRTRNDS